MPATPGLVSITGLACRLPGASGLAGAWDALRSGTCTVTEIPAERWSGLRFVDPSGRPGTSYTRRAGVIEAPFDFDAAHFGISPAEAQQMDPQQRLLLETVAQAFDHAGLDPNRLDADRTGVFVGGASSDHSTLATQRPEAVGGHFMLGNTLSLLSNRISYQWGFRGPSQTIDTACSSGLYAFDLAVRAITGGDIDTAVVAAVNLLLSPLPFVGFAQARMLSPDGLCRAFGAGGQGYVRAEGAVAVILRRTDLARDAGNRIRSVVVATGTNNDGRTGGVALPSAGAQARLLGRIREQAGFTPDDLAFVEAHGTGTAVGDPAEASALGVAYGADRAAPLPIGSAKTNFGHLEPASGLVGLLKAQLALEHGLVPPSLHAETLNPDIDFDGLNVQVVRDGPLPLPHRADPWLAGVSAFGFGGANAHVVIRQPGADEQPPPAAVPMPRTLLLTASSAAALRRLAQAWQERAEAAQDDLAAAVTAANTRIARHRHRLAVPTGGAAGALALELDGWLGGHGDAGEGIAPGDGAGVAFVYAGNGSQWAGMGRDMHETDPAFRAGFSVMAAHFRELGADDPAQLLFDPELDGKLDHAEVAQPLLLCLQVALTDALAGEGVIPSMALGHSVGEVAAAVAAGRISRRMAAKIVVARTGVLEALHGKGGMAALETEPERARELIWQVGGGAEIAAENGPRSLTVAGSDAAIAALLKQARAARIAGARLSVAYPYHSSALDPFREPLLQALGDLEPGEGRGSFLSTSQPGLAGDAALDAAYWWGNARNPVLFASAVERALGEGAGVFLEISPRPVLKNYVQASLDAQASDARVLTTLTQARARSRSAGRIAREVLAAGGAVDRTRHLGRPVPLQATLPEYPFERARHELDTRGGIALFEGGTHPLLGHRPVAGADVWQNALSLSAQPWLADHRVDGQAVLPAMAIVEVLCAAIREGAAAEAFELRNLAILRPVHIPEEGTVCTQVRLERGGQGVIFEAGSGGRFEPVARASVFSAVPRRGPRAPVPLGSDGIDEIYAVLAEAGIRYGPEFRRLQAIGIRNGFAVSQLRPADDVPGLVSDPRVLDAALHVVPALLAGGPAGDAPPELRLPRRIGRVSSLGGREILRAQVALRSASDEDIVVDCWYYDGEGRLQFALEELRLSVVPQRRRDEVAVWNEVMVPAGPPLPVQMPASLLSPPAGVAGDLAVIRDAIAGRLAWDLAAASAGVVPGADQRLDAARDALKIAGVAVPAAEGDIAECPWPDVDALLELLVLTEPEAVDVLRQALCAAEGRSEMPRPIADAPLLSAAETLARRLPKSEERRVLYVGPPDRGVVGALADQSGHVTVLTDETASLPARNCALAKDLAGAVEGRSHDLVLLVSPDGRISRSDIGCLAAASWARLVVVDRSQDLFAAMSTADSSTDRARVGATLERAGHVVVVADDPTWPGVRITEATHTGSAVPDIALEVTGSDAFAGRLREGNAETALPATHVFVPRGDDAAARAEYLARAAAAWNEDGPLWLVSDREADWPLLCGIRRVAANETGRDIRCACLSGQESVAEFRRLIALATSEEELFVSSLGARAPRLVQDAISGSQADGPVTRRLSVARRGALETLGWRDVPRRAPDAGEVEIRVEMAALNFRDVMWALGSLPAEALEAGFSGLGLGMECTGIVERAGPKAPFAEGEAVIALARDALSGHVTVPAGQVFARPGALDPACAATIPVAFFTADYALNELARLAGGETVLIHGAAGGVGQAAIQIAKSAGARVLATAGTPEKRRLVQALGADRVFDSRTPEFEDAVRMATGGVGADVVLNTLSGEAMERSLACLAPFGRFVELGKRDFYEDNRLGMRGLSRNVSYFAVDADQLLAERPDIARRGLDRVLSGFQGDRYSPLPCKIYPADGAEQAFRAMQRGDHVGKILIRPPEVAPASRAETRPVQGTWLVTGGTRGFGFEVARWLLAQGATKTYLASRTGTVSPEDHARLGLGAKNVECVELDVTDAGAVDALMDRIAAEEGALSGVVHAAMVLDDAPIGDLDAGRIGKVLDSKAEGAALLDRATRRFTPDHFWLFSSVAARFGNPGQAAYVAANLALEQVARRRRAEGLPALAVAWGPISDVGVLADDEAARSLIERQLGRIMTSDEALSALERLVAGGFSDPTITISPISWPRLARDLRVLRGRLAERLNIGSDVEVADALDLAELIARSGEAAAREEVLKILVAETARILQATPDTIDRRRPLGELGFDSLMGMNLKLAIEERLALDLPFTAMSEGPSLDRIALDLVQAAAEGTGQRAGEEMERRHLPDLDIPEATRAAVIDLAESEERKLA